MLKVHILMRRRSDMTHEQCVAYWRDVHAPLLRKHADWDERIHRIHAAKLFVRNPYIQGHCC